MTHPPVQGRRTGGPRTILVVGATGSWGGSVARHLLGRGFGVRALTRDPACEDAQALRAAGAEPVAGDLGDRPSLRAALAGCWGAFGVLDSPDSSAVGAALAETWSSRSPAPRSSTSSSARRRGAGVLQAYARSLGLPATYLHGGFPASEALGCLVAEIFERPGAFVGLALGVEDAEPLLSGCSAGPA